MHVSVVCTNEVLHNCIESTKTQHKIVSMMQIFKNASFKLHYYIYCLCIAGYCFAVSSYTTSLEPGT